MITASDRSTKLLDGAHSASVAAPSPIRAESSRLLRGSTCLVLAAAFTLIIVQYSVSRGKLILPATYDDVSYLRDGLSKLDGLYRGGVRDLAGRVIDDPPHSPLATLLAFTGFALFGAHDWAPYVLNGLIILGLLACADAATRGLRYWQKLAVFVFVLSAPIAVESVYEFRPDLAVGLTTAAMIIWLGEVLLVQTRTSQRLGLGLMVAIALVAKPSWAPVTLAMMLAALVAALVRDRIVLGRQATSPRLLVAFAQVMLVALLVPLPWYIHNRHEIVSYLRDNALGRNSYVWRLHSDWAGRLLYYSTGHGGQMMLGRHLALFAGLAAAGGVAAVIFADRRQRARAAFYVFMLLLAYAGPTLQGMDTPFLAATFYFLLLFAALAAIRATATARNFGLLGSAVILLAMCLGVWWARLPGYWGEAGRGYVLTCNRYMNQLYAGLHTDHLGPKRFVLVAVLGSYANSAAFSYMAEKDNQHDLVFSSDFHDPDLEHFRRLLEQSQFVIIGDPDNPEDVSRVAYTHILPQTLAMVRSRPDFILAETCPAATGKNYYLFTRRPAGTRGLGHSQTPTTQK